MATKRNTRGTRAVHDSFGELRVPADALYGATTQRAVENFPISGLPMPGAFLRALGLVKAAAAEANGELGLLPKSMAKAIAKAAREVAEGQHDAHFPIDVFQTGSGTSSNMNANEVIATLASRSLAKPVHPNDHVNLGQSSNDVIPTAVQVAAALCWHEQLRPALEVFGKVFYCGERPGLAQSMKLANNFLSATGMAASSEAIAMGVKAGLDPSLMCDVINAGSGMNTATTQKFPRSVLPGTFDYGFGMALMVKDVRLFLAEAEDYGIPVEVAKAVGSLWEAAMKENGEQSDFTELAKTVEKRAGVTMRAKKK